MLHDEPTLYQLTTHRNNYNSMYGDGAFEHDLNDIEFAHAPQVLQGLMDFYGEDFIRNFLSEYVLNHDEKRKEFYEQIYYNE